MSDNAQSTPPAPVNGDSGSASTQPQTRRERRLLEEARARAAAESTRTESTTALTPEPAAIDVSVSEPVSEAPTPPVETRSVRQRATMRRRKPRASKRSAKDHKGAWSASLRSAVVVVVGAFMATVSLPSTGFNLAAPGFAAQSDDGLQVVTASDTTDTATAIKRDGYKVSSYGDLYGLRFGSLSYTYTVLNTGPIRWPFPAAVPISSGYGHRQAPCAACSSDHKGLDFNPGAGSPIYAIADGVVVESYNDRWGFGRWIVIRHDVNGLQFDSIYAHMQRDSVTLNIGDTVAVTDYVGRVGSTGTSTGAHLHLEIHVNGVQVDPFTWLKANTAQ
jgi:murein DD-endopeptidase MepM/ murein hydrolase activator NlpD